jgi:hypothetical protein
MKYSIKNPKVTYNPALDDVDTSKMFTEKVALIKETLEGVLKVVLEPV